jgi:hypothetical protein
MTSGRVPNHCIQKPVDLHTLEKKIAMVLRRIGREAVAQRHTPLTTPSHTLTFGSAGSALTNDQARCTS